AWWGWGGGWGGHRFGGFRGGFHGGGFHGGGVPRGRGPGGGGRRGRRPGGRRPRGRRPPLDGLRRPESKGSGAGLWLGPANKKAARRGFCAGHVALRRGAPYHSLAVLITPSFRHGRPRPSHPPSRPRTRGCDPSGAA